MNCPAIDAILLEPACSVSADTSSLILLNRCQLLRPLCGVTGVVIAPGVQAELHRAGGESSDAISTYYQLIGDNLVEVADRAPTLVDASVVWLQQTGRVDAVLSDDGAICARCRRRRIPYMNALVAAYRLWVLQQLTDQGYCRARTRLLRIGRYSTGVAAVARRLGPPDV